MMNVLAFLVIFMKNNKLMAFLNISCVQQEMLFDIVQMPIVFIALIYLKLYLFPEALKYWVGVQQDQSYLRGRRCIFSFGWQPF